MANVGVIDGRAPYGSTVPVTQRRIVTPEGVALPVYLAQRGERAVAFFIDQLILLAILAAIWFVFGLASMHGESQWLSAVQVIVSFLIWTFYFAAFEVAWRGATPGKRLMGLRVIDRRGGPLRTEAVIVRNLTREIEVFLPVAMLVYGSFAGWQIWLTSVWLFILALMPLFNRDRMRVGDLIAGTWVIDKTKRQLLPDLTVGNGDTSRGGALEFQFTSEQLSIYGVYELQVLEEVLRRDDSQMAGRREVVGNSIRRKISWQGNVSAQDETAFLEAFYTALRAHLERRILFGERRENKLEKSPHDARR